MRPLVHPAIDDVSVEGILHALSDPVRMAVFAALVASPCTRNCSDALAASRKSIPKSTLSQHFKILRDAGLVRSERQGVEMHNTARCAEIEARFPGLLPALMQAYRLQAAQGARGARARRARKQAPAA